MLQWKLLVKSTLSLILSDSFLSEVRTEHLGSTQHFDKKYEKDLYFGEKSWEQAEVHLLKEANTNILKKN